MDRFKKLFDQHRSSSDWFLQQCGPGKGIEQTMIEFGSGRAWRRGRYWRMPPKVKVPLMEKLETDQKGFVAMQNGERVWLGYIPPPGVTALDPIKHVVYPAEFLMDTEVMEKANALHAALVRPKYPFWTIDAFKRIRRTFRYWLSRAFNISYEGIPIFYARATDYNEHEELDMSRKNYFRENDEPEIKIQVNSTLYDDLTYGYLEEVLNRRKYVKDNCQKYRYEWINMRRYPAWTEATVNMLREMFAKYDPEFDGFITLPEMCKVLDEYGDRSKFPKRQAAFKRFIRSGRPPNDKIEFEEFLRVVYLFTVPKRQKLVYRPARRYSSFTIVRRHLRREAALRPNDNLSQTFRIAETHACQIAKNGLEENLFCSCF